MDVVIVSYRSHALLRACLESLEEHKPRTMITTYVVDNASGDRILEMVRSRFPNVRTITSNTNLGFGAASNVAIREGRGRYVLVLNPDTRITKGALDRLLELMDEHPEVGICGCRLARDDGSFDHASKRSFPTVAGALGHFLGIGRHPRAPHRISQYRAPRVEAGPVDAVNGAFMLMRRAALEEVGLFDEGFWMYMEDLDLCYRFREAGWATWYEPSVTVWHVKGGTTGPIRSPRLNYAFHYGMYRFYRKHYARRRSTLTNLVVYLGIALKLAFSIVASTARLLAARVRAAATLRRFFYTATPRHAWRVELRRALGRTRLGYAIKRRFREVGARPHTAPPKIGFAGEPVQTIANPVADGHDRRRVEVVILGDARAPGEAAATHDSITRHPDPRVNSVAVWLHDEQRTTFGSLETLGSELVLFIEAGVLVEESDWLDGVHRSVFSEQAGVVALQGRSEVRVDEIACAVVARQVLESLGGLSPLYATVRCALIDFSLKAREAGYRNVVASSPLTPRKGGARRDPLDEVLLLDRWDVRLAAGTSS